MVSSKPSKPKPSKGPRSGENARSGPTVPEHKRARQKKTLRLLPTESEALATLAARWGITESAAVARAVEEALARG